MEVAVIRDGKKTRGKIRCELIARQRPCILREHPRHSLGGWVLRGPCSQRGGTLGVVLTVRTPEMAITVSPKELDVP